jgi:hypothetical protein
MADIKPGTLMVITGNASGHYFNIGETVRVVAEAAGTIHNCENLDGGDYWYVSESDMKPLEAPAEKSKRYLVIDGFGWSIHDALEEIPDNSHNVFEIAHELVKKVTWEKKDA